jgi:hypothetical protein
MFQYAAIKGIAANREFEFCLPPREVFGIKDPMVKNSDTNLYDCFLLSPFNKQISNNQTYVEQTFAFDENLFNNCPDNLDLIGYFQTEKYFKHIEDEIRKDFTFSSDVLNPSKEQFESVFGDSEVISLHVRRGDYVGHSAHPVQSIEYYEQALSRFDSDIPVLVFSDDPDWCMNTFTDDRFSVSQTGDTRIDLCLMSMCDYHIIANSSYSWWGSWLAKSKKTIAPSNWFSGELSHKDIKDIYCEGWEII